MKILPLSDLHLEWGSAIPDMEFCDEDKRETIAVLAGDISNGSNAVDWIANNLVGNVRAVVYVPGNHEYYGGNLYEVDAAIKKKIIDMGLSDFIFHLNGGETVVFDDVKFIGATLWTDMNGGEESAVMAAHMYMNDYRAIYSGELTRRPYGYSRESVTVSDTVALYLNHRDSILSELRKDDNLLKCVVTHHLPSYECILPWFKDPGRMDMVSMLLNHAYASDLDHVLNDEDIHLWIHGHSHAAYHKMVGNTVVCSNALGYPGSYVSGFDPNLRLTLEKEDEDNS